MASGMGRRAPHLQDVSDDPNQAGGGSAGGGGDLVDYRLGELERRVGNLENSLSEIQQTVTTVKEQMNSVATKHTVAFWVVGAVVVNFLSLFGHLLIRSLGSE